jgi:hypothetical protein
MKYVITEAERREILGLYNVLRPLQILSECKFTTDGKFIIYEGIAYSCETGDQVPINEAWTLSDTLHTVGDVLAAGSDFIIPGSGAMIDTINALSYIIEAQFTKDPQKKKTIYIMAAITFAFVVIPGPLEAVSTQLKAFVRGAKVVKTEALKTGVSIVNRSLTTILTAVPNLFRKVLQSKLGQKMLGRYGEYLAKYLEDIVKGVKAAFEGFAKETTQTGVKAGVRGALDAVSSKSLFGFVKRGGNVVVQDGAKVLRKAGFAVGRSYRYMGPKGMTTVVIKQITDDGVIIAGKEFGQAAPKIGTFLSQAIGAPWLRRGKSVLIPLFIKRFADFLLPDGSGIDYNKLNQTPDGNPDETSQESLGYTNDELASYEGDKGSYTVNTTVTAFQNALIQLGYTLPQFGADGKFGPETQQQLKKFQQDYQLENSLGKMDKTTAKMLATGLKQKNIQNSEQLQNTLNSF